MSLTLTCPHCSTTFPVSAEDRGFAVYCSSCGRECEVPANAVPDEDRPADEAAEKDHSTVPSNTPLTVAAEPVAEAAREESAGEESARDVPAKEPVRGLRPSMSRTSSRRRPSVFSAAGSAAVLEKRIGEIDCFCGSKIPVSLSDIGTTVYCEACGAGLPVGEKLEKVAVARPSASPAAVPTPLPVAPPRFRWIHSRKVLITAGLVAVSLAGGLWLLRRSPASLPAGVRQLLLSEADILPAHNSSANPPPPAAKKKPSAPAAQPVTLETINQLLKKKNPQTALLQAQAWDRNLQRDGVPASEPRRQRLKEVMRILLERMTPPPLKSPPHLLAFQKMLDLLDEALAERDVRRARQLDQQAAEFYRKHPGELAAEARWLIVSQQNLRRLELETDGLKTVEEWLDRAVELVLQGKPTQALTWQTRAVLLAGQLTNVSENDRRRLVRLYKEEVKPLVKWGRGRRAVNDAEECQRQHDKQARDEQLEELAFRFLPEIGASLPRLPQTHAAELNRRARQLAAQPIANPVSTTRGAALHVRLQYEQSLDHLRNGRLLLFAEAATAVKRRFDALPGGGRIRKELAPLIRQLPLLAFDLLAQRLAELDGLPVAEQEPQLRELRQVLQHLSLWKEHPRWQLLNDAVRTSLGKEKAP